MKKFFSMAVIACVTVLVTLSNSAAASGSSQFFISRVNPANGSEFIQISNSGGNTKIGKLSIFQGKNSKEVASISNVIFQAGGSILFAQNQPADAIFSENIISEKAILRVQIDGIEVASFCAAKDEDCVAAGLTKNSPYLRTNQVVVNNRISQKSGEYEFLIFKSTDEISHPQSGGVVEIPHIEEKDDDSNEENSDQNQDQNSQNEDAQNSDQNQNQDENSSNSSDNNVENEEKSGDKKDENSNQETSEETSPEDEKSQDENPQIPPINPCESLRFNEILINSTDGFFEIKNISDQKISLQNCQIAYGKSKKFFKLPEIDLEAGQIWAIEIVETGLKPAKTAGEIFLLDAENLEIDTVKYQKSKPEISLSKIDGEWKESSNPTFGEENILKSEQECPTGFNFDNISNKCQKEISIDKEEKSCEIGYFRNPETGRCKKLEVTKTETPCQVGYERNPETNRCKKVIDQSVELAECAEGYERNPETSRCRKVASVASLIASQLPCAAGYYRSPETNRCRKIAVTSNRASESTPCRDGYYRHAETNRCRKIEEKTEPAKCKEGYERNPETNRCRKIVKNTAAGDAVEKPVENSKKFSGWWAIWLVLALILGIIAWEFRKAIWGFLTKFKKNS